MARVKFRNDWFAPSDAFTPDRVRAFNGRFFKKQEEVEIPDDLLDRLPKSAEVLDKKPEPKEEKKVEEKKKPEPDYRQFDVERAAADAEAAVREEADKAAPKKK